MSDKQSEQLAAYLQDAVDLQNATSARRWSERVWQFLRMAFGLPVAEEFAQMSLQANEFDSLARQCGFLEGLIANEAAGLVPARIDGSNEEPKATPHRTHSARRVFVVHGHDGEAKEAVARFLEKLNLDPVILHEQANKGNTVIEKFEAFSSDVAFAVVLLTPDDVGGEVKNPHDIRNRARQNVILELGYFLGRLGRQRVCALHKGGVELPSDFQGVMYVELDSTGAWRTKLAQELVEAKLAINLDGLIQ